MLRARRALLTAARRVPQPIRRAGWKLYILLLHLWIEVRPPREIAVVMCVFRRPQRLGKTLEMLSAQRGCDVKLHIWNNNPDIQPEVDRAVAESSLSVAVRHSDRNIGGFGRFTFARELAARYDRVVMIDDDEDFTAYFLACLEREFKPHRIVAFWAWILQDPNNYWDRTSPRRGGRVKYCGTGGLVCPTSIFMDDGLFDCPARYRFVEDLWLSYYAETVCGWKLYKTKYEENISLISDEHDLWPSISEVKQEFLHYLLERGWSLAIDR
jgi:hypothetical protein